MAVPKGGFKITIDDGFEKMNKYYNTGVKGWSIPRIDSTLKEMFNSNKTNLQGEYDFLKASYILLESRAESLQKRLEEKQKETLLLNSKVETIDDRNNRLIKLIGQKDSINDLLKKSLQNQKEINKLNAESWDEMYHKLNARKTIKQQFYSASNFIWLLGIVSAIIGLFMPVFIPWLKASISLIGLSYIAQNKSFINLFYKK